MLNRAAAKKHGSVVSFVVPRKYKGNAIPAISIFPGIISRTDFASGENGTPHFHAYSNEHRAMVDVRACEVDYPKRQARLVLAWAEVHQDELMANWRLVRSWEDPFKIQPLQ